MSLSVVRRNAMATRGEDWPEVEQEAFRDGIRDQYERQGNPYHATARLWDDGIIDPRETRRTLGLALRVVASDPDPHQRFGVFRM